MKTTITTSENGRVTLSYDDYDGTRIVREFTAPAGREGYVRELGNLGEYAQPCEGLYRTGTTLICSSERLPAVIRSEWRARRRHEAQLASIRGR